MAKKMPLILLLLIVSLLSLGPWLPIECKAFAYGLSLTLKSLILFVLPLLIFSLLFNTTSKLASKASMIIVLIFASIIASNFMATFLAQFVGAKIFLFDIAMKVPSKELMLNAPWQLKLPSLVSNDIALLGGVLLGLFSSVWPKPLTQKLHLLFDSITQILLKGLSLIVPFFVAGFVIKLQHEGVIQTMWQDYAKIFSTIFLSQIAYIFILYNVINRGRIWEAFTQIKTMLPAAFTGFSTMSSAAAMPLTMLAAEKNAQNKSLARSVIPASVNIHLLGDCFAIPILAFALLKQFGLEEPTFLQYLIFTGYFVLAKFSVAAIPGGGILVMLPILETYLGLSGDMLTLITALYILFDPVITTINILGNGALAQFIDKASARLFKGNAMSLSKEPKYESV